MPFTLVNLRCWFIIAHFLRTKLSHRDIDQDLSGLIQNLSFRYEAPAFQGKHFFASILLDLNRAKINIRRLIINSLPHWAEAEWGGLKKVVCIEKYGARVTKSETKWNVNDPIQTRRQAWPNHQMLRWRPPIEETYAKPTRVHASRSVGVRRNLTPVRVAAASKASLTPTFSTIFNNSDGVSTSVPTSSWFNGHYSKFVVREEIEEGLELYPVVSLNNWAAAALPTMNTRTANYFFPVPPCPTHSVALRPILTFSPSNWYDQATLRLLLCKPMAVPFPLPPLSREQRARWGRRRGRKWGQRRADGMITVGPIPGLAAVRTVSIQDRLPKYFESMSAS
ncbi:hypothetical protein C8F04DRAFT_1172364 [Mycena alexandri]|uniref:Uncharacterized protein n=1 Tax=Mycena alexandri TaxID=1745969 RepID=A0AAD6XD11_9AGAR|nr:hypothetical protein C8F04DRAFT_1172364 [Mycena alexandri]